MRSFDWSASPLGPVAQWPLTLRTTVGIMLASRFAMRVLWGPDLIFLHNDAYRPVLGTTKYPGAMGRPTEESFRELWGVVGPMFDRVMGGEAIMLDDRVLPLDRHGYLEECFFTLSYSPLSDDRGGIGGVLGVVYETTQRVLAERRLRVLRQLAAGVSGARTATEVCEIAAETFANAAEDVPFALLYLRNDNDTARLVASTGLEQHPRARPEIVQLGAVASNAISTWPLVPLREGDRSWAVPDVATRFGELHGGPHPEPITNAIVLSLHRPGAGAPYGYVVAGVSPRRALDPSYEGFFELAAEHIVASIANAVAFAYADTQRTRLMSFLLDAPAAIAVMRGPRHLVDLANARYCRLVGRSRDELVGKPIREAVPELSEQGVLDVFDRLYETGEPFAAREFPALLEGKGNGVLEQRYFDWVGQATRNAHGIIDGVMMLVIEVTEQVLARRAVEASRLLLEGAVRQMAAGIIIVEAPRGNVLLSNESAHVILGRRPVGTADVGRDETYTALRLDGQPHLPRERPLSRALAGENVPEEELILQRSDGSRRTILANAAPVYDPDGKLVAAVASFVDITERKTIELALRESEERGRTLLARAEAARSEAESASRAKDEFLAIVSHELRNPLNAMLGWTRLLRSGSLSAERSARALETIERNAVNQAQLIEDLLDVSRVISGKLPLDVETVIFARVIETAIDSARPAIDAKGLRLSVVLDTDGVLSGDPGRLQQIVWNLLTNATKFTPRGGSIRVVLRRDDSQLELCVTDSGMGIERSFLAHVFDRFKQADPSTTRQHGGLGLGLAIAKNLVEMHGGTIEARSEGAGKGATFIVRVPVAAMRRSPVPAPPVRIAEEEVPPVFDSPVELRGLRVLVVDDEPDARELVMTVLAQCGASVSTAISAATALALVEAEAFDVLISDIGMPAEDGYALIARVRSLPRNRGGSMPAACLTGYTTMDDRRRALTAGFNMHLAKPIEPIELIAVAANLARMAKALRGGE